MTEQTVDEDAHGAASRPDPHRPWYRTPVSRDPDGRKVAGVVSGVARAYGFDVTSTRIAVAIATVLMPALLVVYGLAWLVLPERPEAAVPLQDVVRDRRRLPLMIVIGIVVLAGGFGWFGSWHLLGGIPWGLGLIAIGVLLWVVPNLRSDDEPASRLPSPGSSTAAPPPAPTWPPAPTGRDDSSAPPRERIGTESFARGGQESGVATLLPPPPTPVRAPTRRRVPIGLWAVLTAFAFLAVGAVGDALDWWDLPVLAGTITVLAILAAGAGVTALVNRSWRTVPILVMVTTGLSFLAVTLPDLDGGCGERTVRPSSLEQAQTLHRLGIGQLTVDLTALPDEPTAAPGPTTVEVRSRLGIGRLRVIVPDDAVVRLDATLGAGHIVLDGREIAAGVRHDGEWIEQPTGAPGPTFVLHLELGMGEITVERAAPLG